VKVRSHNYRTLSFQVTVADRQTIVIAGPVEQTQDKPSKGVPVLKFFPGDAPAEPSENLKAMKVRDLLTMSCGHDTEPKRVGGAPSVEDFLAQPVPHRPGTHFLYNTMGSYTLSAIVTKATGQTSLEFLKPRLFETLGIENPD